jgi:GGDEF domain-containing protein/vacuolar-type H+-ATPase subunit F/Vma7
MPHADRGSSRPVTGPLLRVLAIASAAEVPGFAVETSRSWADAIDRLAAGEPFDVVLVDGDAAPGLPDEIAALARQVPLVVAVADADSDHACGWLRQGADDVIGQSELGCGSGARRLRFAVERRRRRDTHPATHSTDPATGLPHRPQLLEHLSQLLALREREPASMALLALRIEGLRAMSGGAEASEAAALRRKIAVRLRAGVRASDVVAVIDDDAFAVLLGSLLAAADAERVAAKLVAALLAPFTVGAVERSLVVTLGVARYPDDGHDAERLLRRALALAAAAPASVRLGAATTPNGAGFERAAANDDR